MAIRGNGLDDVIGVIAKGRSKTGQYGFMTPNASALSPMIPAMVKKILTVAFVSVVSISFGAAIGHYAFMSLFDWVTSR